MKKAFSLLELVLVLAILGIVISFSSFYFKQDLLMLAARQIINDIYYTRSLALNQSSFKDLEFNQASRQWYKSRWQIYFIKSQFTNNEQSYSIFLDKNGDANANLGSKTSKEIAQDPLNPQKLISYGQSGVLNYDDIKVSKRFNLYERFKITDVEFLGSCKGTKRLVFDDFGMLYSVLKNSKHIYDRSLAKTNQTCTIKLFQNKKSLCINISAFGSINTSKC